MRVTVLLLILVAAAAGQPVPESFVLDTGAVWWPVDSIEEAPAVAASGDNFLVVWQTRSGTQWDVHAARVTHAGEVLDPDGFVVSACSLDQLLPQVAEGPSSCLVAWEDERSGSRWGIYGARVDKDGQVLDPDGLLIRQGTGDSRSPAIAYGHGHWLVAWEEQLVEGDIYCALVDTSGSAGSPVPVCRGGGVQSWPAVGATDSGFVIAWEDWRNGLYPQVRCARLDPDGVLLDTGGVELWPDHYDQERPAVARCGDNVLVAWEESALLDSDVWGLRLAPSGAVLDSAPIRIGRAPGPQRRPKLVDAGQDVLALWSDSRNQSTAPDVYSTRVRPDGSLADSVGRPLVIAPGHQDQACIACADTLSLLAWRDMTGDTLYKDIRAARLTAGDSVLDPGGVCLVNLIVALYYSQEDPAVGSAGGFYLVAWVDLRDSTTGRDIYGMRFGSAGTAIDSAPFVVCSASGTQESPLVSFNGQDFLVVWVDYRAGNPAAYAARVDTSGRVLDTLGIPVFTDRCYDLELCAAGDSWLVAWRAGAGSNIEATFVLPNGTVTHPNGFEVTSPTTTWNYDPVVRFGRGHYQVLWTQSRPHYEVEVRGLRLASDGSVLDTARYYSNQSRGDTKPVLEFDGESFLAAWLYRPGADYAICCTRIDTSGAPIDSPPVYVYQCGSPCSNLRAVYNGTHYYLVWAVLGQVKGARVGPSAAVFDTFLLVTQEPSPPVPALAADSAGGMMMVYAGRVDSLNGHPVGVDRIKGVLSPYGGVAEPGQVEPARRLQAWPTLFRHEVELKTGVGPATEVEVCDAAGRVIRTLSPSRVGSAAWDGRDRLGRAVGPGVYFARTLGPVAPESCKLVKLE